MAKISVGINATVNFFRGTVEFSKLDIRIDDVDLEVPIDEQLENFDEKFDAVYNMMKEQLKSKILKIRKVASEKSK